MPERPSRRSSLSLVPHNLANMRRSGWSPRQGLASIIRAALLVAALSTYFVSADDVVWLFIKGFPHARVLEHVAFGAAAILLGWALLLKLRSTVQTLRQGTHGLSLNQESAANLLQAIGIGFLLPLPGFILLVLGDLAASLLHLNQQPTWKNQRLGQQVPRIRAFSGDTPPSGTLASVAHLAPWLYSA